MSKKFVFIILGIAIAIAIIVLAPKSQIQNINNAEGTKFHSDEFLSMSGEWELTEFMGVGIQSHISPEENGYNPSDEDIENNNKLYLDSKIIIDEENVTDFYPPEFKYYFNTTEELFFGYKIPFDLQTPILYINVEHKDFEGLINFIQSADGISYLDINGYFYKLKKIN